MKRRPAMTEGTYFILAALMRGPLHGYAIIKRAQEQSGGRVRLAVGTLYGALDRLAANGSIAVDREETVAGRPRRYFKITDEGLRAVLAEAARMEQAARIVRRPSTRQAGPLTSGAQTGTARA